MLIDDLTRLLLRDRYPWRNETELQDGLLQVLTQAGFSVEREVVLEPGCRIDFVVDRVGLEVKVKGSVPAVMHQLQRYASSDRLDSLVLATTKGFHRELPAVVGGKPLTIAYLTHIA